MRCGSHAVKLTATSNNATGFGITQNITTVSNEKYQISVYERFNSRTAGTLYVEAYDLTNSVIAGINYRSFVGNIPYSR